MIRNQGKHSESTMSSLLCMHTSHTRFPDLFLQHAFGNQYHHQVNVTWFCAILVAKKKTRFINALFVVPNSVYWQVHVMLKELFICHVLVHGVARSTHPTGALGHACTESLFSTTATCNLTWSLSRENQYAQIKINLHTCCLVERITLAEIIKTIIAGCSRLSFLH